jgi:hypothetical protein
MDHLLTHVSDVPAASKRHVWVKPSPHFEMRPAWLTSPDWYRRGIRPRYAPTRDEGARTACGVVNGRHERDRGQSPDAGNRHQLPASVASPGEGQDPRLEHSDLPIDQIANGQQRVHGRLRPRLSARSSRTPVLLGTLADLANHQA